MGAKRLLSGFGMPILDAVPNPADRHSAALSVADRDRVVLIPLTAVAAQARLLVVTRRSGV